MTDAIERIRAAMEQVPQHLGTWCEFVDACEEGCREAACNPTQAAQFGVYIAACNPVAIQQLLDDREHLISALELAKAMCDKALPKFNWGASFLDGEAIHLLNIVPARIQAALKSVK